MERLIKRKERSHKLTLRQASTEEDRYDTYLYNYFKADVSIHTIHGRICKHVFPWADASGETNSQGVTGGVYRARVHIHRGMLIRDY